tara:strand:+ start:2274 stop:3260 length:987 start_codon:yes stop_codon:yes gene_type:complete
MSIRYWLYAIALGGCLTGNPLAYAQEGDPKPLSTVEDSEGASVQPPAPNGNSSENPADKEATTQAEANPTTKPLDSPSEEESCGPRCQAAEDREDRDLAAQESMAASTVEIANLTLWQAGIGAAGLVFLGFTLYLTRESLAEARRATEAAEDSLEAMREQTRAYLLPQDVDFTFKDQCPHMRLKMVNTGNTGTRETRHLAWIYFDGVLSCPRNENIRAKQNEEPAFVFAAAPYSQVWKFDFQTDLIPQRMWNAAAKYTVHISMHAIYRDVFGFVRHDHYAYRSVGIDILIKPLRPARMRPAHGWDDACDDENTEVQKVLGALKSLKSP